MSFRRRNTKIMNVLIEELIFAYKNQAVDQLEKIGKEKKKR